MPEIIPDLRFIVKLTTEEFRLIATSLAKSSDPEAVAFGDTLQRIRGSLTANLSRQGDRLVHNVDRGGPARRVGRAIAEVVDPARDTKE